MQANHEAVVRTGGCRFSRTVGGACLVAAMLVMPACVLEHGHSLRARAEAIFRHHNQVASDLMLSISWVEDDEQVNRLLRAEQAMNEACQTLDELAARRRDGKSLRFTHKRRVLDQLDRCEEETNKASAILAEL